MSKKQFVWIMTDTTRYDMLGCYGNPAMRTPNLDALAAESAVFTRAFTPLPVCAPVRQSLMNGLHPVSFGAQWNYDFFMTPTAQPTGHTWAEQLRAAGYRGGYICT